MVNPLTLTTHYAFESSSTFLKSCHFEIANTLNYFSIRKIILGKLITYLAKAV